MATLREESSLGKCGKESDKIKIQNPRRSRKWIGLGECSAQAEPMKN